MNVDLGRTELVSLSFGSIWHCSLSSCLLLNGSETIIQWRIEHIKPFYWRLKKCSARLKVWLCVIRWHFLVMVPGAPREYSPMSVNDQVIVYTSINDQKSETLDNNSSVELRSDNQCTRWFNIELVLEERRFLSSNHYQVSSVDVPASRRSRKARKIPNDKTSDDDNIIIYLRF